MLLASPTIIVFISPRRLISRPIWRLISREKRDNCSARSWLIIFSGGIRLLPRRSICLMCAAPKPVVFPVILLIVGNPFQFNFEMYNTFPKRAIHLPARNPGYSLLFRSLLDFMRCAGNCQSHTSQINLCLLNIYKQKKSMYRKLYS